MQLGPERSHALDRDVDALLASRTEFVLEMRLAHDKAVGAVSMSMNVLGMEGRVKEVKREVYKIQGQILPKQLIPRIIRPILRLLS